MVECEHALGVKGVHALLLVTESRVPRNHWNWKQGKKVFSWKPNTSQKITTSTTSSKTTTRTANTIHGDINTGIAIRLYYKKSQRLTHACVKLNKQATHNSCLKVRELKSRSFEGSDIHDRSYRKHARVLVLSPGTVCGLLLETYFDKGTVQRPGRVLNSSELPMAETIRAIAKLGKHKGFGR